jgi:endonuclease/exonuclease/phosphatase family metal-dependent hydrolase
MDSGTATVKVDTGTIRVVTYNVHKCRGLDRKVRPDRILKVLQDIDADVVALQEVLSIPKLSREDNQVRYLAEELDLHFCVGENRKLKGGAYGNVILSRLPIVQNQNYDISVRWREQRGCLRADLAWGDSLLHVFNVHFGTDFLERRFQVRKLINTKILHNEELQGLRLVMGDFNEWTRGLTSQMLSSNLNSVDLKKYLKRSRTYPGVLPILHLDHIYFDEGMILKNLKLYKSRTAMIASDHLPLIAEFEYSPKATPVSGSPSSSD